MTCVAAHFAIGIVPCLLVSYKCLQSCKLEVCAGFRGFLHLFAWTPLQDVLDQELGTCRAMTVQRGIAQRKRKLLSKAPAELWRLPEEHAEQGKTNAQRKNGGRLLSNAPAFRHARTSIQKKIPSEIFRVYEYSAQKSGFTQHTTVERWNKTE